MDLVGLQVLKQEFDADARILAGAVTKAVEWIDRGRDGDLEACAYEMNRWYTTFERTLERICSAFENHFDRRGNYHEKLLHRLTLDIPGIRPALIPQESVDELTQLRRFRHLIRHAYDLTLRQERLRELVSSAQKLSAVIPAWYDTFEKTVRKEQGW